MGTVIKFFIAYALGVTAEVILQHLLYANVFTLGKYEALAESLCVVTLSIILSVFLKDEVKYRLYFPKAPRPKMGIRRKGMIGLALSLVGMAGLLNALLVLEQWHDADLSLGDGIEIVLVVLLSLLSVVVILFTAIAGACLSIITSVVLAARRLDKAKMHLTATKVRLATLEVREKNNEKAIKSIDTTLDELMKSETISNLPLDFNESIQTALKAKKS